MRRLPAALFAAHLLCIPAAHAQLSGSAGILSNYLYRGVSLSGDKAVPRLSLNYDGAAGWYAGGQVIGGQMGGVPHRSAQWTGYAGYARRLDSGLSWEAGVSRYAFPQAPSWHFDEVFAGIALDGLAARLNYSPDYLGLGVRTLYAECQGSAQLIEGLGGFWHLGYLGSLNAAPGSAIGRYDLRLGLQTSVSSWRAELSFNAMRKRRLGAPYYDTGARSGKDVVLSLAYSF
ncbi:TorF family putative porin [Massilia endophytica]|uniref:TorF family putative porin n=1 Tax=Massilia endophytica TaxID=2899220 RepID=UPI001E4879E6|nr:TorF family putative porin [Massilia endophytica]UGQ46917.1 TorF family putative porin [Massilia endophytica]